MKNTGKQEDDAFRELLKTGLNRETPNHDLEHETMDKILELSKERMNVKKVNSLNTILIINYCLLTFILFAGSLWDGSLLLSVHEFIPAVPAWEWHQQLLLTRYYFLLGVISLLSILSLAIHALRSKKRILST